MTVAYDNESTLGVGTGDRNWNHAGGASARAALVIIYDGVTTDQVVGVTYGGTTMTEVTGAANSPVIQSGGEGGSVHAFFLDNCGTGTKNVAIDRNDATNYGAVCYTVTGTQIYIHNTNSSTSTSTASPQALLTITRPCFVAGGIYSGLNSVTTSAPAPGSGVVATGAADFGTDGGQGARGDSIKTGNFTFGWTQTADDGTVLVIALADRLVDATVADTVASLSESPSTFRTLFRSGSDGISSISEAPSSTRILNRSGSDTVASLSESPSSVQALSRSGSDGISSLSESPSSVQALFRSGSDGISSITETPSAASTLFRSWSDEISSILESVVGEMPGRSATDDLSSITEVPIRTGTFIRREWRPTD